MSTEGTGNWSLDQAAVNEAVGDALTRGFTIHEADERTLLLDIDKPFPAHVDQRALEQLERYFPGYRYEHWMSKSGNTHVKITLPTALPTLARIVLQAALGSDPVREILAMLRAREGVGQPVYLFEP